MAGFRCSRRSNSRTRCHFAGEALVRLPLISLLVRFGSAGGSLPGEGSVRTNINTLLKDEFGFAIHLRHGRLENGVESCRVDAGWTRSGSSNFLTERIDNFASASGGEAEYIQLRSLEFRDFCLEARPVSRDNGLYILGCGPCAGHADQVFVLAGHPNGKESGLRTVCLGYDPKACLTWPPAFWLMPFEIARQIPYYGSDFRMRFHDPEYYGHLWPLRVEFEMMLFRGISATLHVLVICCPIIIVSLFYRHRLAVTGFLRGLALSARAQWSWYVGRADERRVLINKIATRQRLLRARLLLITAVLFIWAVLVFSLPRLQTIKEGLTCFSGVSDEDEFDTCGRKRRMVMHFVYSSEVLTSCLVLPAMLFLFACPALISSRSLDVLNIYLTFAYMAQWLLVYNHQLSSIFFTWLPLARLFQCIMCGHIRLTIGLQLMFTVFEKYFLGFDGYGKSELRDTRFQGFALIVGIAIILEVYARVTARAIHEAQRASHSESLVTKLLGGMNDAVVFLDIHMLMTRSSANLAALLMNTHPDQILLKGSSFLDLCHPDDQERLLEAFRKDEVASEEGVAVNAATARLRDISGNLFTVELTWAYMHGEAECFLVGIREMSEGAARAPATLGMPDGVAFAAGRNASHNSAGEESSEASSSVGSPSGSPASTFDAEALSKVEDLFVVVDTKDLTIQSYSSKFALFFFCGGFPDGRALGDFFYGTIKFQQWWHAIALEEWAKHNMASQRPIRRERFTNVFIAGRLHEGKKKKKNKKERPLESYRLFELEFEASLLLDSPEPVMPNSFGTTHIRVLSRRELGFRIGCAGRGVVECDI